MEDHATKKVKLSDGRNSENSRYTHLIETMGEELFQKVQSSKVLVVGAGGIGCELLKNLVLSGFKDIEIIDLDTIDLSNLNRQFLFQRQHIGKSKSQVAKESALRFNPDVNITAHHGNVKNHDFGPDYFKKFTLVMNALDNLDARRHVNRLCIATERPLIESGTAGYHGQVQVILRGITECYECYPKPAPKTYAYCTIRSNPKEPIHCIIWGKEEFRTYFGDPQSVIPEEDEGKLEDEEIKKQEEILEKMKSEKPFEEYLFHKLFYFDIFKKVRVATVNNKDTYHGRKDLPKPLTLDEALKIEQQNTTENTEHLLPDQHIWTTKQNAQLFLKSAKSLKSRSASDPIEFDKDDADALDFVTSASNLRSHIFTIPIQSRFNVKSLAGNIIPAIATTNAVTAGLIVIEALKVIQGKYDQCRMTYLQKAPSRGRLLLPSEHEKPNANCFVCGSHFATIKINTNTSTLGMFVDKVLKQLLGFNEPSIIVNSDILYECGEDLEDDEKEHMEKQKKKLLKDVKIVHSSMVDIDDNSQNFSLKISIVHCETFAEEGQAFEVVGKAPAAQPQAIKESKKEETTAAAEDDVMIVENPAPSTKKRKADENGNDNVKKQKPVENTVIEL